MYIWQQSQFFPKKSPPDGDFREERAEKSKQIKERAVRSAKPHKKLKIWQDGVTFCKEVYRVLRTFPREEQFTLISQIKQACISIPSNIAEGAARSTKNDYIRFLYIARGSISEIDTLLELASELQFLSKSDYEVLTQIIHRRVRRGSWSVIRGPCPLTDMNE